MRATNERHSFEFRLKQINLAKQTNKHTRNQCKQNAEARTVRQVEVVVPARVALKF